MVIKHIVHTIDYNKSLILKGIFTDSFGGEGRKKERERGWERPELEEDKVKVDKEVQEKREFPGVERNVQVFVDSSICVTQQRTEGDSVCMC